MFFSKVKRALVFVFFIIGFVCVLGKLFVWFAMLSFSDASDSSLVNAVVSPDGTHVAEVIEIDGGGAISPYCVSKVIVRPSGVTFSNFKGQDKYEVFSASCLGLANKRGLASPSIRWADNRNLEIEFSIGDTNKSVQSIRFKSSSSSGQVAVRFFTGRQF